MPNVYDFAMCVLQLAQLLYSLPVSAKERRILNRFKLSHREFPMTNLDSIRGSLYEFHQICTHLVLLYERMCDPFVYRDSLRKWRYQCLPCTSDGDAADVVGTCSLYRRPEHIRPEHSRPELSRSESFLHQRRLRYTGEAVLSGGMAEYSARSRGHLVPVEHLIKESPPHPSALHASRKRAIKQDKQINQTMPVAYAAGVSPCLSFIALLRRTLPIVTLKRCARCSIER